MMDFDTFVERLTEAVDFPEAPEFKSDTVFQELKYYDSLAALGIILMFDQEFSVKFIPDYFFKLTTVQDLYDFAMGKISIDA